MMSYVSPKQATDRPALFYLFTIAVCAVPFAGEPFAPFAFAPTLSLLKISFLALAAVLFASYLKRDFSAGELFHGPEKKALLVFLAWNLVSIFWASDPRAAFVGVARLGFMAAFFFVWPICIKSKGDQRRFSLLIAVQASLLGLWGIVQVVFNVGFINQVHRTLSGNFVRASASFPHPVDLGLFLLFAASLLVLFFNEDSPKARRIRRGLLAWLFICTLFTFSKVLIPGVGILLFMEFKIASRLFTFFKSGPGFFLLIFIVCGLLYGASKSGPAPGVHIYRPQSVQVRHVLWDSAMRAIGKKPLVGHGAGMSKKAGAAQRRCDFAVISERAEIEIHNLPLTLWTETGIIGLSLFALFWLLVFYQGSRKFNATSKVIAVMLLLTLYACCQTALYKEYFWLLFAALSMPAISQVEKRPHRPLSGVVMVLLLAGAVITIAAGANTAGDLKSKQRLCYTVDIRSAAAPGERSPWDTFERAFYHTGEDDFLKLCTLSCTGQKDEENCRAILAESISANIYPGHYPIHVFAMLPSDFDPSIAKQWVNLLVSKVFTKLESIPEISPQKLTDLKAAHKSKKIVTGTQMSTIGKSQRGFLGACFGYLIIFLFTGIYFVFRPSEDVVE